MDYFNHVHLSFTSDRKYQTLGFKLIYTYHYMAEIQKSPETGLFNCNNYTFVLRQHLDCNLHVQCSNGWDENELCDYHQHKSSDNVCQPGEIIFEVAFF